MNKLIAYILPVFFSIAVFSQDRYKEAKVHVVGEDISTPGYVLNDVVIQGDNSEYLKNYRTTRYFVRRVYAYSQLASAMLIEYQDSIAHMSSKRDKRKYLKQDIQGSLLLLPFLKVFGLRNLKLYINS